MSPDTDFAGARLAIAPHRPTLDTELHIVVSDLTARARVTLRAEATDPRGGIWRSSAVFEADDHGVIDLRRDAPVSGGYLDADPMGLIWSMRPDDSRPPASARTPDFLAATPLRLVAEADGMPIASTEIQRLRVPDGLSRTEVREHGLVGTLYRPDTRERLPGVVLLGGAEGGMHEDDAALLAAHGYAALALAYYGSAGLAADAAGRPSGVLRRRLRPPARPP